MALDKQKILNDLGNVMNQLQGADCGCMGKLFSNPAQGSNAMRQSCNNSYGYAQSGFGNNNNGCGHGHSSPCAHTNEPCQRRCMGMGNGCNPKKLYADTYSFLNTNLMQPVVQEVYEDLKSLTPENTVTNNSALAQQMGLLSNNAKVGASGHNNNMSMNSAGLGNQNLSSSLGTPNMMSQQQVLQSANAQQYGNMAGMGPQIVEMFSGGSGDKATKMPTLSAPRMIDGAEANSANRDQFHNSWNPLSATPASPVFTSNPVTQYGMTQPNDNYQTNTMNNLPMTQNNVMSNPNSQSMAAQHSSHGAHSQGLSKFSDMFPGVMKKDLGYDPMAIAIQMNPANQTKSTMNNMTKIMNDNKIVASGKTPVNFAQQNLVPANQANLLHAGANPNVATGDQQQLVYSAATDLQQQQIIPHQEMATQQSQLTQQSAPQNIQYQHLQNLPPGYETMGIHNQETILPVDTTKTERFNTLGQSVEMLPARMYHYPEPKLPQTLSPSPVKYSNVKSTVSKTAIVGEKTVRSQSKSQLQHIYNQYKGSQSYTQQNIPSHGHGATSSEGRLNVTKVNPTAPRQTLVEQVGGDSFANNFVTNQQPIKDRVMEQTPNMVETNKPSGDVVPEKVCETKLLKPVRNGLQDIVHTKYAKSAAWSFHGRR